MGLTIGIIVVVVILLLLAVFVIAGYNGLVRARNAYKNAFAQIDVQLRRRFDLIPNLIETAKGYMAHERQTLDAVDHSGNDGVGPCTGEGIWALLPEPEQEACRRPVRHAVQSVRDRDGEGGTRALPDESVRVDEQEARCRGARHPVQPLPGRGSAASAGQGSADPHGVSPSHPVRCCP